jgi:hypothetical protein
LVSPPWLLVKSSTEFVAKVTVVPDEIPIEPLYAIVDVPDIVAEPFPEKVITVENIAGCAVVMPLLIVSAVDAPDKLSVTFVIP